MKTNVYIGPAGWSYPDWNGIVYPQRKPSGFDPLTYLASYFNLIEVNSTFYRLPHPESCARWVERVDNNPDFLFTAKAHQDITHKRRGTQEFVDAFKKSLAPLHQSGRLSAVLLQFPWSFRYDESSRDYVQQLRERFQPFETAVEVRHGSWADASDFFDRAQLTMCGIDQPLIGQSLARDHACVGSSGAYYRLHGRNYEHWFKADSGRDMRYDYLYNAAELQEWVQRIREMSASAQKVHVVLNNHFRGQAIANAMQVQSQLSGKKVKAPPGVAKMFAAAVDGLEVDTRPPSHANRSKNIQGDLFD